MPMCTCVCTCMGAHVCVCYQRTASPWTMWIPGIKPRSSGCKHPARLSHQPFSLFLDRVLRCIPNSWNSHCRCAALSLPWFSHLLYFFSAGITDAHLHSSHGVLFLIIENLDYSMLILMLWKIIFLEALKILLQRYDSLLSPTSMVEEPFCWFCCALASGKPMSSKQVGNTSQPSDRCVCLKQVLR